MNYFKYSSMELFDDCEVIFHDQMLERYRLINEEFLEEFF